MDDAQESTDMQEFISVGKVIPQRLLGILPGGDDIVDQDEEEQKKDTSIVEGEQEYSQNMDLNYLEQDTLESFGKPARGKLTTGCS